MLFIEDEVHKLCESTAAKEAEHAQKSEELTQKKQAEAEAARAAKEAQENRHWRIVYIVLAAAVVIGFLILSRAV